MTFSFKKPSPIEVMIQKALEKQAALADIIKYWSITSPDENTVEVTFHFLREEEIVASHGGYDYRKQAEDEQMNAIIDGYPEEQEWADPAGIFEYDQLN